MPALQKSKRLDQRTDAILNSFDKQLASVLAKAQARTAVALRSKLTIEDDGTLRSTAKNLRAIQSLPQIFRQAMASSGYDNTVAGFLKSFDGGVPIFEEVLREVTDNYQINPVDYTAEDAAYFKELKRSTAFQLEDVLSRAANQAKREAIFSVAGTPFDDLTVELAERLHTTLGEASTIAATGISTFYRTVAESGYDQIEEIIGKKGLQLEYTYYGPQDKLTRPFCTRLMTQAQSGRTWTRAEIDKMDNEQLPDVFTTCGGFNCRHQWVVALEPHPDAIDSDHEKVRGSTNIDLSEEGRQQGRQVASRIQAAGGGIHEIHAGNLNRTMEMAGMSARVA
jgi:hypothetical protein